MKCGLGTKRIMFGAYQYFHEKPKLRLSAEHFSINTRCRCTSHSSTATISPHLVVSRVTMINLYLPSSSFPPMDLSEFPYKMPVLNRLFIDAHYLWGLEEKLRGFDIVHTAETYFHYTQQCLNAKGKAKVIATVLENIPFNNEGIWGRKAFKARARRELDHIVALTHKTKEALIAEGADTRKMSVIPHFIDTKRFLPETPRKPSGQFYFAAARGIQRSF